MRGGNTQIFTVTIPISRIRSRGCFSLSLETFGYKSKAILHFWNIVKLELLVGLVMYRKISMALKIKESFIDQIKGVISKQLFLAIETIRVMTLHIVH